MEIRPPVMAAVNFDLPVGASLEVNVGQTDSQVDFISRGSGYTLFLTPREAVLALRTASASPMTGLVAYEISR